MYTKELRAIYAELSHADATELQKLASRGGWRKWGIESGKTSPSSVFDLKKIVSCVLSRLLGWLPPMGDDYRRSVVAQAILDCKASAW